MKIIHFNLICKGERIVICRPPPDIPGTRKNYSRRAMEGTIVTYECVCGEFSCSGQCYQDAVCMRNPAMRQTRMDRLIGLEVGHWVGVPREGDCLIGCPKKKRSCSKSLSETTKRKKIPKKKRKHH